MEITLYFICLFPALILIIYSTRTNKNYLELNTACRLNTALHSQTIKNSVWPLVITI